ncbi:hypothetical protein I3843_02G031800 [Carya illinoinensis]|nr:hypothetical protein I3843_02G031800 [Carya illinoinensis]
MKLTTIELKNNKSLLLLSVLSFSKIARPPQASPPHFRKFISLVVSLPRLVLCARVVSLHFPCSVSFPPSNLLRLSLSLSMCPNTSCAKILRSIRSTHRPCLPPPLDLRLHKKHVTLDIDWSWKDRNIKNAEQ